MNNFNYTTIIGININDLIKESQKVSKITPNKNQKKSEEK